MLKFYWESTGDANPILIAVAAMRGVQHRSTRWTDAVYENLEEGKKFVVFAFVPTHPSV
jgi:hypothetical protein